MVRDLAIFLVQILADIISVILILMFVIWAVAVLIMMVGAGMEWIREHIKTPERSERQRNMRR